MECKNVIKYLVFVLNMILVLGGVTLLGFGVHVYLDMAIHRPIMGDDYHYVSLVLMILGLSTFLVALFGCLGSYKEYVFVVVINAVCYSLLTLGLFGVVAWLILQKVSLKKSWKISSIFILGFLFSEKIHDYNFLAIFKKPSKWRSCARTSLKVWLVFYDLFDNINFEQKLEFLKFLRPKPRQNEKS